MSAPAIRGLAVGIRSAIGDVTKLAAQAAADLASEVEGFKADVSDVQAVTADIKAARADVRAALGQGTNGGPPLDSPTTAAASTATPSATSSTPSGGSSQPSGSITDEFGDGRRRTPLGVR